MALDDDSLKEGDRTVASARNGEPHPSLSASAARRSLGEELRSLRRLSKLTLNDVAAEVQRSAATMSRLERGAVLPRTIEINALLDLYERQKPGLVTQERRASVLLLVDEGRADNWIDDFSDVMGSGQPAMVFREYLGYEADAIDLRSYEPELIPGLLQSPAYARAMAETYREPEPEQQKDRFVALRLERQRRLGDRPLHVVINEAALHRPLGPPGVMPEQLSLLAEEIRNGQPSVTIQIVPLALAIPATGQGSFVLMRIPDQPDVVSIEHPRKGPSFYRDEDHIAEFEGYFADLKDHAYNRADSLTLIDDLIGG